MKSIDDGRPGLSEEEFSAGVFLIDKPVGMSSFGIVRRVRYLLGIKKVGHAGTLDPFADGLLVVCAGRPATRMIEKFMGGRKTYQATLKLGVETTTLDPEGEVTEVSAVPVLTADLIETCLQGFRGKQLQAPPAYSAAKYKGKPLYHYARKGIVIEKEPKPIEIYSLECTLHQRDRLDIEVQCSRGTYIRVLAADIGKALGCGAHLTTLRRTWSGPFSVEDCLDGEALKAEDGKDKLLESMMSVDDALARLEEL